MDYSNKGNFLSIIELLSKYDSILEKPHDSVNYLSPAIQNEVISLTVSDFLNEIVNRNLVPNFFQ